MIHEQFILSVKNPILSNHKVYGQELLPGLAYIDILYQVFQKHHYSYNELELSNLTIYNPLIVRNNYSVLLNIQCVEVKEQQWKIQVEGQEQHNEILEPERKLYVTAEMHRKDVILFEESLNINSMKQTAKNIVDLCQVYEQCKQQELVHAGFMKAQGTVYEGAEGSLIDISLGEDALGSADKFMFHPTLVDSSGIGSWIVFSSLIKDEQRLFLPIFYESFRASALIQKKCLTRVQTTSIIRKKELIFLTLEYFNESGEKIAELKNFIIKQVRADEVINVDREQNTNLFRRLNSIKPSLSHSKIALNRATMAPANETEMVFLLRKLLAEQLKKPVDQIETQVGYYEMGLNSSRLLRIVKAIETEIGISLPPTLLFEYTTINELAAYLNANYLLQPDQSGISEDDKQEIPCNSVAPVISASLEVNYPEYVKETLMSPRFTPELSNTAAIRSSNDDIAIIGMAGRYPKARNLQDFWTNLKEGKDCISIIPQSRWDWHQFEEFRTPSGKEISKWGGFIDDPDCFDSNFFRISPRESVFMDPQERLFLETSWEVIEDAGYTLQTIVEPQGRNKRRLVGVFVGMMQKDYALIGTDLFSQGQVLPLSINNAPTANRVSYFCNFHGPSITVDTLCASSLTAVHLALESIKSGECEVALAGGVNLSLHPYKYTVFGVRDMLSSDAYCHTFGKGGDGYVSAEGVGVVLLKPLSKAIQDRDHIYAVIKGSMINHGGSASGITVPNPIAQSDMIEACLEKSGIHPGTISYVEAHGTGTALGDPIEIQGLTRAFRHYTPGNQFCSIGSVKSNIGHAESAAGISALHKVTLQLYYKTLTPSLHSEELNPYIDFIQSPFYVQNQTSEWKQPMVLENGQPLNCPRRAIINSLGAFGSNAHIILEEYLAKDTQEQKRINIINQKKQVVIPLSAKNKEQLQAYVLRIYKFLLLNYGEYKNNHKTILHKILEVKIRKILASVIHVNEDSIEMKKEWTEYRLEPVQIIQVREKIQEEFQLNLKEVNLKSSINSLVSYLINHHYDALMVYNNVFDQSIHIEKAMEAPAEETSLKNIEVNIFDLSYTLQVGRDAMDERVVFLVRGIPELLDKLAIFGEGNELISNCWQGQVRNNKENNDFLNGDPDFLSLMNKWIKEGNFRKIAELWVKGYTIDWEQFYNELKPRRISLPTYPFAKEHYWAPESGIKLKQLTMPDISNHSLGKKRGEWLQVSIDNNERETAAIKLVGRTKKETYSELELKIAEIIGKELNIKELNVNDNLFETGFNSLNAIKLEVELGKMGIFIEKADVYKYPSVAGIASFITNEINDDFTKRKVLDNFEPFNDIYYRHCFYNALFPVIKHFNKDPIRVLVNDVAVYTYSQDKEVNLLVVDYKSEKTVEQLLKELNISLTTKMRSDNIIGDIIASISKNKPVIIAIDCFYIPMREDLYQKDHWEHFWLVYGYDDPQRVFHVIEHKNRGSLTYKKYLINYEELVEAYNGCLMNFRTNNETPTFYEFYYDIPNDSSERNGVAEYKEIFTNNIRNNKDHVLDGINEIKVFEESFKKIISNEDDIQKNIHQILEMLNPIIDSRKADVYKIKLLYPNKKDIIGILSKVIDSWEFIRLKVARCAYGAIYTSEALRVVVKELVKTYENELQYNNSLLSFFEEGNG